MKATSIAALIMITATTFGHADETGQSDRKDWRASKPASEHTILANRSLIETLSFDQRDDFDNARKGYIGRDEPLTIRDASGNIVWDMESFKALYAAHSEAPDSVNPSLWRNGQLLLEHGLYKVTEGIYQVRGYDVTNITFVAGNSGWIVFDPALSPETAAAAKALVDKHLGKKPVKAVIYSHSHIDHYGGAKGLISREEVDTGQVEIIAPEGFSHHAVSENVTAGNAMARRAIYMFGAHLPRDPQGNVSGGLGLSVSTGSAGLMLPTSEISQTGETRLVDGVELVFQMTPGSEAPAEMNTWLPTHKALWMAENTTHTLHNVLTLRGAQVRDALQWSKYIDETLQLWGDDAEVVFQSHHWPTWGRDQAVKFLAKQRDIYRYIHDQSVRMMNQGASAADIAEQLQLPEALHKNWPTRGYYGTVRHNARAVYQRYMGWYSGNPSDLNPLPPSQSASRYVEYMGGEQAVIERARRAWQQGDYRWVAEVMRHVVFANPNSVAGKALLADSYEQLGYQAESGVWRAVYLQGAWELRNGIATGGGTRSATPDTLRAMTPEMIFDYLAVRLNGERAAAHELTINMTLTDSKQYYHLLLTNGVLHYRPGLASESDASLQLSLAQLQELPAAPEQLVEAIESEAISIDGSIMAVQTLISLFDEFYFWFPIVSPQQ